MMNKVFYFIFCAAFIFSCSSADKVPSGIIRQEAMKDVLWDVMRAQFMAQEIAKKDSLVNTVAETKVLTQKAFAIHKITQADFDKSYDWYIKHPDLMKRIFDSLYTQKQRNQRLESESEQKDLDRSPKKIVPVK